MQAREVVRLSRCVEQGEECPLQGANISKIWGGRLGLPTFLSTRFGRLTQPLSESTKDPITRPVHILEDGLTATSSLSE